jgi:trk system potassium uptake protein TrkH
LASTLPAPATAPGPADPGLRAVEPGPETGPPRRDRWRAATHRLARANVGLAVVVALLEYGFGGRRIPELLALVGVVDVLLVAGVAAEVALRILRAPRPLAALRERPVEVAALALAAGLLAGGHPRVAGAVVLVRMAVVGLARLRGVPLADRIFLSLRARPLASLCAWYAIAILIGAIALTFPASTASGDGAPFLVGLFTSTSAIAVTGLAVVDTATYWSHFGHWVILTLVQLGGLGIMTLSTALAVVFGGAMTLRDRSVLLEIHDEETFAGFRALLARVIGLTLAFEAAGAGLLWLRFAADPVRAGVPGGDPGDLAFLALFHAVSAFCNAGFGLWPDNLTRWVGDVPVNAVIGGLIVVGGLGFPVVARLLSWETWRAPRRALARLPIHDRLALGGTGLLLGAGFVGYLALEWAHSLAGLGLGEKLVAAGFASVTARTAGFNTIDYGLLAPAGVLLTVLLMFVGGSPGGTAGGIKTTTVAVMALAIRAMLRGSPEVEYHGRRIPETTVYRAVAVTLISALGLAAALGLLLLVEPLPFDRLLFEAVSAFGTVGLSMNTTPSLSDPGRLVVIALMFVGRIGPFTLALAIGASRRPAGYSFPTGRINVG